MSRYTHLARPVLAGALFLLLVTAWLWPAPTAPSRQLPAMMSPATADATDAAISQWGSTALARPLFNPSRRPLDQPGATADGTLPRLSAIIITGGTSAAVFAADGQKPQVVRQGDTIGGYVLNRITPDHVELSGPGGTLTLHPQFASATAATATPASPPPGQSTDPALNPATNPALMIEQNF